MGISFLRKKYRSIEWNIVFFLSNIVLNDLPIEKKWDIVNPLKQNFPKYKKSGFCDIIKLHKELIAVAFLE